MYRCSCITIHHVVAVERNRLLRERDRERERERERERDREKERETDIYIYIYKTIPMYRCSCITIHRVVAVERNRLL